jgi:hypothetical protein
LDLLRVNGLLPLAYMPLHQAQAEVAKKRVLTSKAVGAMVTDGVNGGNGIQGGEGLPNLVP